MLDTADQSKGLGWLQLSDLQVTRNGAAIEASEVRTLLEKDLRRVHDLSGPWSFVAVCGNITAGGDKLEFARAAHIFEWLWDRVRTLGSEPALVMVPGPCDTDPVADHRRAAASCAPVLVDRDSVVEQARLRSLLGNFTAFADDLERRLDLKYARAGWLPGDSARILKQDGLHVGVLGLNTSLLADPLGHIEPVQLTTACDAREPATWARGCDAVVVVSRHGADDLDPASEQLLAELRVPLITLCGSRFHAELSCGKQQVKLPALALATFDADSFGYRAGRLAIADDLLVARDWSRQRVSIAGTASLGPPVGASVDSDGSTAIAFRAGSAIAPSPVVVSPTDRDVQIRDLAWSHDGSRLAVIRGQGILTMYDRDGHQVSESPVHNSTPCALAWHPDGDQLVTRSRFHVRLWALGGALLAELGLACPSPTAMAWLAPGKLLLGSEEGILQWNVPHIDPAQRAAPAALGRVEDRWRLGARVLALALCPRSPLAAVGSDGGVWLLPLRNLTSDPRNRLASDATHALGWSPEGEILAAGGASGVVTVWDARAGNKLAQLEGLTDIVRGVSFSRDGGLLAATAIDGSHGMWSSRDWAPRPLGMSREIRKLNAVAFSPTADVIALGATDGVRLASVQAGAQTADEPQPDAEPVVRTASAKVVLLGEGNVGKSCLALRLTQDRYEELGSTHGMKFWSVPLDRLDPDAEIPSDERREIVFWDMGGQYEYQLLHHAFLQDTMLALMVMEPRRGEVALRELEIWDRQLTPDRSKVKRMLIGSKLDDDRVPRDPALVSRVVVERSFISYAETSAKTGAGIDALRKAIARAIDWSSVAVTTRPQLFHRIRHYIELRRAARRVVLPYLELEDIVKQREGDDVDLNAVGAVVQQLARQGLIADARLRDGSRMLVLEVEQVERYAASLILAARDNPQGVPALEMASVASVDMRLPRIAAGDRLPRDQELVVLECVVELLIKSGICFLSGRLLIFPALFRDDPSEDTGSRGSVAVAYDFLGPVDQIYSALVCWIALDVRFGALRLSQHRVELGSSHGTCGIRRIVRPDSSGVAGRFEVFFDGDTEDATRQLFAGVVDDFLRNHGVEMVEQLTVVCDCGYQFPDDVVRTRLARGMSDVVCPLCDRRVPLVRTSSDLAVASPGLAAKLRAFRSERIQTRQQLVVAARRVLDEGPRDRPSDRHVNILHLSDLHIAAGVDLTSLLQPLCSDLEDRMDGLGNHRPDLVIVSGDLTNRASPEEFHAARGFVAQLLDRCKLTAERCVVVPGNHDLSWDAPAYSWQQRRHVRVVDPAMHVAQGDGFLVRDERGYAERFRNFSEHFFHPLFQRPYSLAPEEQAQCVLFGDLGIQVIALNSAWQIDEFFPGRSAIHLGALARTLELADTLVHNARQSGRLGSDASVFRVAVWHHPVTGNEKIADDAFVDSLRRAGVRLCLHGHVHEDRADVLGYLHPRRLHVIGAGSFGAPMRDRPESVPRLYNLIAVDAAHRSVRVHTRQLRRSGSAWEPWYAWPAATEGERRAYYEFEATG